MYPAPVARRTIRQAARRIMTDDGFNLGILYRGDRKPYQPAVMPASIDLRELEKDFEL